MKKAYKPLTTSEQTIKRAVLEALKEFFLEHPYLRPDYPQENYINLATGEEYLVTTEAMKYLRINLDNFKKLVEEGKLSPFYETSRASYFSKRDLDRIRKEVLNR